MQELLGRIAALDPNASVGLRVIACFDELVVGNVNIQGLLATAAALAGCPAGCSHGSSSYRVSVLGEPLGGGLPPMRRGLQVDGGEVWLERHGPELPNDAIILERLGLAVGVRLAGAAPERTRRDIAVLFDRETPIDDRREAACRLGLTPDVRYRAVASTLFAEWTTHPSWPQDVMATAIGTIHALIAPEDATCADAPMTPCGLGVTAHIDRLADSFRTALIALQLCESPHRAVDAERYGGLVHLLADSPSAATNPDADALDSIRDLKWVRPTVGALLDSSSVRQSARLLDIHHSTMQSRVEILTDALGFDPLDGVGRARLGMAFLTWRMRHSRALELPPPNN